MKFVPVIYEHAAALIHRRPFEVSRDPDLLTAAHAEAFRQYHHSPVVVGIDIYNIEAEAYGAQLQDAGGDAIPSIAAPLFTTIEGFLGLRPIDLRKDGRFPVVLESAARLRELCRGAAIVVPLSGPFSIAQHLLGMEELIYAAVAEPDTVRDALMVIARHLGNLIRAIEATGCDVIMFESSASPPLVSPGMFRRIEVPALEHIGAVHREVTGRGVALILGGNTLSVLDDMMKVDVGSIICPAEVDGAAFLDNMSSYPEVEVRINMRPGVFASSLDEARSEATRVIGLARGRENVCIGSGVLPFDARPEIVLNVKSFIERHFS
jgi:uroporphyrinogen decarboxylase